MTDLTARASQRFLSGDLAGAIEDARDRVARGDAPPASLALAAVADGAWGPALLAAEAALLAVPRDPLARWCRAAARLGLGDRAGALADWSLLLDEDPDARTAWKDRAVLRALLGDRAGALSDLARLCELEAGDVVPRLWIAGLGGEREPLEPFARGSDWSADLARLVLGRAAPDELLGRLPAARARTRTCQVQGYAGLVLERDGAPAAAFARYEACAATCVWHFLTHLWARERLVDRAAGRP